MLSWTLISEYLALIFIAVIMYFYFDRRQITTVRRRLYWGCLITSAASIVLNIITVWIDEADVPVTKLTNATINSLYFLCSFAMTLFITVYLLKRIYEFSPHRKSAKVAAGVLVALGVIYLMLVLTNAWTGWLFYFDEASDYCRGPLNRSVYLLPVAEVALLLVCYLRNRKSVSLAMKRIVCCIPVVVALLLAFQAMYPEQLLNGTFVAVIDLIIFMNFQSVRVEVDPLTELGNRASFTTELEHRIATKQDYQVMLIGLRSFSEVNRVYGPQEATRSSSRWPEGSRSSRRADSHTDWAATSSSCFSPTTATPSRTSAFTRSSPRCGSRGSSATTRSRSRRPSSRCATSATAGAPRTW